MDNEDDRYENILDDASDYTAVNLLEHMEIQNAIKSILINIRDLIREKKAGLQNELLFNLTDKFVVSDKIPLDVVQTITLSVIIKELEKKGYEPKCIIDKDSVQLYIKWAASIDRRAIAHDKKYIHKYLVQKKK